MLMRTSSLRATVSLRTTALSFLIEAALLVALVRAVGPLVALAGRALGPLLVWTSDLALPVALGALAGAWPVAGAGWQGLRQRAVRALFAVALWLAWLHLAHPDLERKRTLVLALGAGVVHTCVAPSLRALGGLGRGPLSSASRLRAGAVLAFAVALAFLPGVVRSSRPALRQRAGDANLLLITIDTVRQDALGCYGARDATSPHLDRLAADGVLFEDALAQAPHTHASIASLLTATYPSEHRSLREHQRLESFNETLAEHLEGYGYRTAAFLDNPWLTREFGFDQGYGDFAQHARIGAPEAWLAAHASERFFLHVHLLQPHAPYVAVQPWAREFQPGWPETSPYQDEVPIEVLWDAKRFADVEIPAAHLTRMRALYHAEVRAMDEQIGGLLAALAKAGHADDTLVIVASDHGEEFMEHGSLGHSHSLYEELVRVPLLMRLPRATSAARGAPRGLRVAAQAQLIDVAPTALALLGVAPLSRASGASWAPFLTAGEAAPDSARFAVSQVYRVDARHLLLASTPEWTLHAQVAPLGRDRFDDWELSGPAADDFGVGTRFQLFARGAPEQDVAEARPDVVADLVARLEAWRARTNASR